MANIVTGKSDKAKTEQFHKYCNAALQDRLREHGKGCRWRTLPTDTYKSNFDDIFRKKK
jgi:hypothetical protein